MFILKKGDSVRGYNVIEKFVPGKNVFLVLKASKEFVLKVLESGIMSDEIKIGMSLGSQCPYLVKVFDILHGEGEDQNLYMIMEYCEEGDLSKRIGKKIAPTDEEIYRLLYEGAEAIRVLHEAGVIHRDIKSANFFLIKKGGYKLGDYGVARMDSLSSKTMTHVGTDGYMSPEIMEGEKTYTNKVDIYSFGLTLLEFILTFHPYSNDNGTISMKRAVMCDPVPAARTHPHPCARLALRMISADPSARPTAAEILATAFPLLPTLHTLQQEKTTAQEEIAALRQENALLKQEMAKLQSAEVLAQKDNASSPSRFPLKFVDNSVATWVNNSGNVLKWNSQRSASFCVNPEMNSGIYKICISSTNPGNTGNNRPILGAAVKGELATLGESSAYLPNSKDFVYYGWTGISLDSEHLYEGNFFSTSVGKVELGLELDTNTHTLYFFVDGEQKPHCVINVPSSVHFVVHGLRQGLTIELKSLERLAAHSVDPLLACARYEWM